MAFRKIMAIGAVVFSLGAFSASAQAQRLHWDNYGDAMYGSAPWAPFDQGYYNPWSQLRGTNSGTVFGRYGRGRNDWSDWGDGSDYGFGYGGGGRERDYRRHFRNDGYDVVAGECSRRNCEFLAVRDGRHYEFKIDKSSGRYKYRAEGRDDRGDRRRRGDRRDRRR